MKKKNDDLPMMDKALPTAEGQPEVDEEEYQRFLKESYRAIETVKEELSRGRQVPRVGWAVAGGVVLVAAVAVSWLVIRSMSVSPERADVMTIAHAPDTGTTPSTTPGTIYRDSDDQLPQPLFPVNTAVPPGPVGLAWEYAGDAETLLLQVQDEPGNDLVREELPAAVNTYVLVCEAGQPYYWKVEEPGEAEVFEEFRVLGQGDWETVLAEAHRYSVAGEDLTHGVAQLTDTEALRLLHEVFQHYGLDREAEAAQLRLKTLQSGE